ncbi:DUF7002 family protein [Mycolicibacterium sp. HS_4_1]
MDARRFAERYPVLYHMADEASWPSIQRHGLLSTQAIVDLYQPDPGTTAAILSQVRRTSITLDDDRYGAITVRDQLPLKFLDECLHLGVTAQQYLDALNSRVYFWVSRARLETLLTARAYRDRRHLVLHVDTAALLDVHGSSVELAPYNTGSAHVPNVPKRGPGVFVPLADYPFDEWRRKRGPSGEAVVELTVPYAVPDVVAFIQRVELRHGDAPAIAVSTTER